MKKFKGLAKITGAVFIFVIVLGVLISVNSPDKYLAALNSNNVSTRYMELPSGKYAGDTILGTISGKGSFYFDTGESYTGTWKTNEMSGNGTFAYTTGTYNGEFTSNKRNGSGTFTWTNGSKYTGSWSNDKLNGEGILKYDGITYTGTFKDNAFESGKIDFSTETGIYKLTAENGKLSNKLDVTFTSGNTYSGEYSGNAISGNGTMDFANVGKYVGGFSDGKRNGSGTFTWVDGSRYDGQWSNDAMNGQGTYNIDSSTYLKGTFVNGTLNGTFTYHNSEGNYNTVWENGKCTSITKE